jgi:hypothetical protein
MKRQIIVVALGSLFALPAFANEEMDYPVQQASTAPAKTVAQVRDELIAARRTGDFVVNAETGETANQLDASSYPSKTMVAGKSRAEVLAELENAERTGDIVANAESGEKANELYPFAYASHTLEAGKSPAEVVAETGRGSGTNPL